MGITTVPAGVRGMIAVPDGPRAFNDVSDPGVKSLGQVRDTLFISSLGTQRPKGNDCLIVEGLESEEGGHKSLVCGKS